MLFPSKLIRTLAFSISFNFKIEQDKYYVLSSEVDTSTQDLFDVSLPLSGCIIGIVPDEDENSSIALRPMNLWLES